MRRTSVFTHATSSRALASMATRRSEWRLKTACAEATGMIVSSSMSSPRNSPCWASTPITRNRRSPMRTSSPRAVWDPNNSSRTLQPITQTEVARRGSCGGRNWPRAMCSPQRCRISSVDPATGTSRRRPLHHTSPETIFSGTTRFTPRMRRSATASSSVRSRDVRPDIIPPLPPKVSARPGMITTRFAPSDVN